MASQMIIYTKYHSYNDYGGKLEVGKFSITKTSTVSNRMRVDFEGEGSIRNARIYLDPELAIPLARSILSVAEGYVDKTESEIA